MIEYALDTYQVFNFSEDEIYLQFAGSGRFITAIIGKLIKKYNVSESVIYWMSSILAFICVTICLIEIYKIVKKYTKNKIVRLLIPTLIIINPFSIELFLYIEKGIMWFGVLICIYAVKQVKIFFETAQKKHIFFSCTLMFIANCCYQGIIGIFIALCFIYILEYSKTIKDFIQKNIIVFGIYGFSAGLDFFLIKKFYSGYRLSEKIVLKDNIYKILRESLNMCLDTYNILPKYLYIFSILLLLGMLCYALFKNKSIIKSVLKFVYIFLGTIVITVIPQIVQQTDLIWFVPRSTYAFGALLGILMLFLEMSLRNKKRVEILIIIISIIILIFESHTFIELIKDRYTLNKIDESISIQIVNKIKKYENSTGNKVTQIEIYNDKNPQYTYEKIRAIKDINIKAYSTEWSTKGILDYYLKRRLKSHMLNEKTREEFLNKDWNEFKIEEQVILEENMIKICLF